MGVCRLEKSQADITKISYAVQTIGTGSGNEMGRYLKSGDVVELEIEKIGVLRNRVVRT